MIMYRVSNGVTKYITEGKLEETHPRILEASKNEYEILIFGNYLDKRKSSNPLFRLRNPVAYMGLTYLGQDRTAHCKTAHHDNACSIARDIDGDLVVIEGMTFDTSCTEVPEVLENIEVIIKDLLKERYSLSDNDNFVIVWYLNEIELEIVSKHMTIKDNMQLVDDENDRYLLIKA